MSAFSRKDPFKSGVKPWCTSGFCKMDLILVWMSCVHVQGLLCQRGEANHQYHRFDTWPGFNFCSLLIAAINVCFKQDEFCLLLPLPPLLWLYQNNLSLKVVSCLLCWWLSSWVSCKGFSLEFMTGHLMKAATVCLS